MLRKLLFREYELRKLNEFERHTEVSFERMKQENHAIRQWLNFIWTQNLQQQKTIEDLKHQAASKTVPELSRRDVARMIDEHYPLEPLLNRVRHAEARIEELSAVKGRIVALEDAQKPIFERLRDISLELSKPRPVEVRQVPHPASIARESERQEPMRERTLLRDRIVKQLTKNSKDTIKTLIMSLITKYRKISGLQLREMIVEEQHLCSKSSFYRLLEELEQELGLQVVIDGKEKVYFAEGQQREALK